MNRLLLWNLRILGGLAVLALIALGASLLWLRTSLPDLDSEITVPNLSEPVEILRDRFGVPTIRAANRDDAAFALGFVHAQDRFAQMELMRRSGAGRLGEVVGSAMLPADRYLRGFGLYAQAQKQIQILSPEFRRTVEVYADGVNAWLETRTGALPWELAVAFIDPEPWQTADTLVWGRLMALRLTYNWSSEALRARMSEHLTLEQLHDLWPDVGGNDPITMPVNGAGGGSNAWVVASDRKLANDPHLGLNMPSTWYLARIETPEGVLAGATTPGVPLVILGHNGAVAWGMTTTHADTADLVKTPDVTTTERDVITVRGGEPHEMQIRRTARGIIVSDVSRQMPDGWALEGPLFDPDDRTVEAVSKINQAQNHQEFIDALRDFHTPNQNIVFADTAGHIGAIAAGRIPMRRNKTGFLASDRITWDSYIPFEQLPQSVDPAAGRIVNANNVLVGPEYPHYLGREWAPPFRAQRIEAMLDAGISHDRIQTDTVSLSARALLPHLLVAADEPRLAGWNGDMDRRLSEPVLYMAWIREAMRTVFADELGPEFGRWWRYRPATLLHVLEKRPHWCDDTTTAETESCAEALSLAHQRARTFLRDRYGNELPLWGEVHQARFEHAVAGQIPILRDLIGREIGNSGGPTTVNAGLSDFRDEDHPFRQKHGPGFRAIYDLTDLDRSRFMQVPGQSGNPFSPHYDDLLKRWRDGKYITLTTPTAPAHRNLLRPARQ